MPAIKWKPRNPHKYTGDVNNIISRSSWESRFFNWCDLNSAVLEWSSEETIIPYLCGTDNRIHRYFCDAKLKIQDVNGNVNTYLVEIKPYIQTQKPSFPGRNTKKYLYEVETYIKNQSKWAAAKEFAKARGMQFIILTENELGIGKR